MRPRKRQPAHPGRILRNHPLDPLSIEDRRVGERPGSITKDSIQAREQTGFDYTGHGFTFVASFRHVT